MSRSFKYLLTASIIAFSPPAFAQDAAEPQDTPETTTEQPQPPRADGLTIGAEPETGSEEVGKTYVASEHDDWDLRCVKAPEGQKDPCQIYQLLRDEQGNSVAEINLFDLPSGDDLAAGATIITPLETLLTANMRVAIDTSPPKVYPFTFCTQIGCFSRIGLTTEEMTAFRRGSEAVVTIVPAQAPDQEVKLTMSLKGFTAAFEAVKAANAN